MFGLDERYWHIRSALVLMFMSNDVRAPECTYNQTSLCPNLKCGASSSFAFARIAGFVRLIGPGCSPEVSSAFETVDSSPFGVSV